VQVVRPGQVLVLQLVLRCRAVWCMLCWEKKCYGTSYETCVICGDGGGGGLCGALMMREEK
jgi:hypothetical protein